MADMLTRCCLPFVTLPSSFSVGRYLLLPSTKSASNSRLFLLVPFAVAKLHAESPDHQPCRISSKQEVALLVNAGISAYGCCAILGLFLIF